MWDLGAQWKLAADLGSESAHAAGTRRRTTFTEVAAIYSPSKELDFALGLIQSRDNADPKSTAHSVNARLTVRFE